MRLKNHEFTEMCNLHCFQWKSLTLLFSFYHFPYQFIIHIKLFELNFSFFFLLLLKTQINLRCRLLQTTLLTNIGIRPSNLCRYVLLIYSIFCVFVDIVKNRFWERENRHVFKCFIAALAVIQRMIIGERSPCLLVNSSGVYFGGNWVSLVNTLWANLLVRPWRN